MQSTSTNSSRPSVSWGGHASLERYAAAVLGELKTDQVKSDMFKALNVSKKMNKENATLTEQAAYVARDVELLKKIETINKMSAESTAEIELLKKEIKDNPGHRKTIKEMQQVQYKKDAIQHIQHIMNRRKAFVEKDLPAWAKFLDKISIFSIPVAGFSVIGGLYVWAMPIVVPGILLFSPVFLIVFAVVTALAALSLLTAIIGQAIVKHQRTVTTEKMWPGEEARLLEQVLAAPPWEYDPKRLYFGTYNDAEFEHFFAPISVEPQLPGGGSSSSEPVVSTIPAYSTPEAVLKDLTSQLRALQDKAPTMFKTLKSDQLARAIYWVRTSVMQDIIGEESTSLPSTSAEAQGTAGMGISGSAVLHSVSNSRATPSNAPSVPEDLPVSTLSPVRSSSSTLKDISKQ